MRIFKLCISLFLVFTFCFSYLIIPCFASELGYIWSDSLETSTNIVNNTSNSSNNTSNIQNVNNNTNSSSETSASTNNITNNTTSNETAVEEETNSEVADDNFLGLDCGSAILIEQTTGQILYAYNIHEQLHPASVTKVMSILLIMEAIDSGKISLTDEVPCSENAASMGGSQIWLDPRETLTVDEMLKAICVNSANDCVVAMAEYIAGSEEAFVQMMNDKAKELGMNDTNFMNCHGLDEEEHVTSAYDIALMSRELLNNHPDVTKYTTIWMDTLRDGKSQLSNTNKLIKNYKGATGLKTGSTSLALYNLSASATRDNLSLIAVIMKAPTSKIRFEDATKLLDYGFNTFSYKEFGKKDDVIKTISVNKGSADQVEAVLSENCGTLLQKGSDKNVEQTLNLDENISAPVQKGQKLGEISFTLDGEVLSTVDIVAKDDVEKIGLFSIIKKVYYSWVDLLRS